MGQDDWSVPSVTLGDAAAADAETTINDYYDTVADKYGGLASDGADGFSADYTVTYNQGRVLSVRRTVREGEHGALTLYAETFNTEDGGLLVAADFFTVDEADWTDRLIELVTAQLASQSALALTNGWEDSVRAAFDRDSFYLTDTGYVVFYPAGTVASGAAPLESEIPYEDIADIFAMP